MLKKIRKKGEAILLSMACILSITAIIVFQGISRVSALEYNETNPDFEFTLINSESEKIVSNLNPYDCTGTFTQKDGEYKMTTDAYTAWSSMDDVGFAHRTYNIGSKRTDVLTVEATVTDRSFPGNSYPTASVGVMLRESLEPGSPEIFLHCRDSIAIVYRSQWNSTTIVKYSGVSPVYPVSLKIEKAGTQYVCYFKNNGQLQYTKIATLGVNIQGPVLGGFSAHACMGKNKFIVGGFKDYSAVGKGDFEGSDPSGSTSSDDVSSTIDWEDAPLGDDVMLSETFTDGSMTDGDENVNNPIWSEGSGEITIEENGNRVWTKNFVSSHSYAGDEDWTDYSASVDFKFTENCDIEQSNFFALHIRHREISYLGIYDYSVALYSTIKNEVPSHELRIYRRYRSREGYGNGSIAAAVEIDNYLTADKWQNIYVEAMDNNIKVWLNGEQKLDYTDQNSTIANLKGGIGITTYDTDIVIDNIVVRKLNDPLGGDYDNDIGGNFDMPIPDYVQQWGNNERDY